MLRKISLSDFFWKLLRKTSPMESFLSKPVGFPGSFPEGYLKQLCCREDISACFHKIDFKIMKC